ncbi:methylmalonyl-CoA mutase subunit beta [Tamlana fucoidanivorans]|uniref:Methylmalonyl-CoA mutase n=1 Tax=Allotamlana fucoidanivorans TaxID=2583814 RepID=A0A5C4SQN2_9FLAO|nr:methylmalonyl-CoA mutase subunit beta [Tamlana fucoidanivorans]TNJ46105.1 methylmalonyl-CoA mutase [Tamlana fucoidanivorans]
MTNGLFDEFNAISAKQWKQKIQFDLKGADYNKTLVWQSEEGISVKPFYHADDFSNAPIISKPYHTSFKIAQTIFVAHAEKSNAKALDALSRGAECIKFIIHSETIAINVLLKDIDTQKTPVYFELQFLSESFIQNLLKSVPKEGIYVQNDIIYNLSKKGNFFTNLKSDFSLFSSSVNQSKTVGVDASLYQNAGANIIQQLAYALAHANEYLNHLAPTHDIQFNFTIAIGSNYFFEIAKLKALRLLWDTLASEYKAPSRCQIFATPTKRNKTLYDYNNNMLRTTSECMSAILGGADMVSNLAYDAIYHKDNEFGERMARNQLLLLKYESYFDKVTNPSDGAYYIESITNQLAEKALELFKDIENQGGFLKQLKYGVIQRKIKESAHKEQQLFNHGEKTLIGSNKYINSKNHMKNELELYPFVKTNPRKTLIQPIIAKRLSEQLEQNRLKNEL